MAPIIHERIGEPHTILSRVPTRSNLSISVRFSPATTLTPTRTLTSAITRTLTRREVHSTSTIPGIYGAKPNGPDVGTVVGITLGSVAGFLLLLWLIYTCLNSNNPNGDVLAESEVVSVGTASVVASRQQQRHRHRKHRSPRRETVEIRTSGVRGPIVVEDRRGGSRIREVRVEETSRYAGGPVGVGRSVSRGPGPPPPPPGPRVVDDDDDDDDDEIVVMEERTPPRRHRSRRQSVERRSGGYRGVETDDVVVREVRRESRRR